MKGKSGVKRPLNRSIILASAVFIVLLCRRNMIVASRRVKVKLAEINARYAEGGDHDPIMTEARKNCPRKLKGR